MRLAQLIRLNIDRAYLEFEIKRPSCAAPRGLSIICATRCEISPNYNIVLYDAHRGFFVADLERNALIRMVGIA